VRDFDPEVDSLLIHVDGDAWVPAGLSAEGGGTCADGAPGRVLTVHLPAQQGSTALGAPIRGFEIVTYRLYRASDGLWHIGLLDRAGGTIQPLIGPVAPDGFELTYYDSAGAGTSLPERVSVIELKVRAGTVEPVRAAGALVRPLDSVVVVVALRNNPRF
jgi:hypothetical protein